MLTVTTTIGLSVLTGALALTNSKMDMIPQQPLLEKSCPTNSILENEECRQTTYDSIITPATDILTNISHTGLSLEESRRIASQAKDFPWTFWPECFSNENLEEPLCVFGNQDFARGRGIFVATTKTFAYAMLEKDAFRRPDVLAHVNNYDNPPFVQHDFPGKGRGLVANKTLQKGDQIFASTPVLITDPDMYQLSEDERLALLYRGVETLPPASQARFWELLGHFNGDPVDDRINTNNFEVTIDGTSQSALFPEIAMLNHDCRPNAAYFFDEQTMAHHIHAIKTIQPGEEITITYIDNEQESSTRMQRLKRNWGFDCSCSSCTAHPAMVAESDSRLQQIQSLTKLLDDWSAKSHATPEAAELLISLYEQERLYASLATAYKHAAEVYSSFGKKFEAIKYARLSTEMSILDKGFADSDVAEMKKMSANPTMSWSWRKRVEAGSGCGCSHGH
ncbi:hypothetical protein ACN47E_009934 [Coniothyrium glycines]